MSYPKLDPIEKKEWTDALLSGEYTQGYSTMCQTIDKETEWWCCLGVYVDATQDGTWEKEEYDKAWTYRTAERHRGCTAIPFILEEKIGRNAIDVLVRMNDVSRKSFKEIAAWIKRNL